MAILPGSLNPSAAATLARTAQDAGKLPGKGAEGAQNGAPPPKEAPQPSRPMTLVEKFTMKAPEKEQAKSSEAANTANAASAATEEKELGQLQQGLKDLKGLQPTYSKNMKDAFGSTAVATAKQVGQVGAITQGTPQVKLRQREAGAPVKSQAATVPARTEAEMPDDLALLDMSGEQLGQPVDLKSLTDDTSVS